MVRNALLLYFVHDKMSYITCKNRGKRGNNALITMFFALSVLASPINCTTPNSASCIAAITENKGVKPHTKSDSTIFTISGAIKTLDGALTGLMPQYGPAPPS